MELSLWNVIAMVVLAVVTVQVLLARRSVLQLYKRIDMRFDQILVRFDEICRQLNEIRARLGGPRVRPARIPRHLGCLSLHHVPPAEAVRVRRLIAKDLRPPRKGGPRRFRRRR